MKSFYKACTNGRVSVVKKGINDGINVNGNNSDGWTPLIIACWHGRIKVVEVLINAGADVNQATHVYQTCELGGTMVNFGPLYAACWNGHPQIVKILIKFGADVNKRGFSKETPLYTACWHGYSEMAKMLIAAGADIHLTNKDGDTPLLAACKRGEAKIVSLFPDAALNFYPGNQLLEAEKTKRYNERQLLGFVTTWELDASCLLRRLPRELMRWELKSAFQ